MARKSYQKKKTQQGRGTLLAVTTVGPHVTWLGMPEYYMHTLRIDDQEYVYFSNDKLLGIDVGSYVCFRHRQSKHGPCIDKHSLGVAIDPVEYMRQQLDKD
jgi:hypothetical protein